MMTGYRTLIVAILTAGASFAGYASGSIGFPELWLSMQGIAAFAFLRLGLRKSFLSGYKTYLSQLAGIIGTLVQFFNGEMTLEKTVASIAMALIAFFFRMGEKNEQPPREP